MVTGPGLEASERTDDLVTRSLGSGDGLDETEVLVGLAIDPGDVPLEEHEDYMGRD